MRRILSKLGGEGEKEDIKQATLLRGPISKTPSRINPWGENPGGL
jgi:hypothetical protein